MKQTINEVKRMQKLANIINENLNTDVYNEFEIELNGIYYMFDLELSFTYHTDYDDENEYINVDIEEVKINKLFRDIDGEYTEITNPTEIKEIHSMLIADSTAVRELEKHAADNVDLGDNDDDDNYDDSRDVYDDEYPNMAEESTSGDVGAYDTPVAFIKKKKMEGLLIQIIKEELLNEVTYHKFKNEVKFRTKNEQLHKAIREVKRKIIEIDRIVEYTSRMKQELSEGEEGIRYWKATNNNMVRIAEMLNQLTNKIKNLQQ